MPKTRSAIFAAWITVLAGLATSAALAVTNTVPFSDDFESYSNNTPLIDGTNGWYASSSAVIVQNNTVYSGTKAARIPPANSLSNLFTQVFDSNIWVSMRARPSLDDISGMADDQIASNDTAIFYVSTSGYCVVYNGANGWTELATKLGGAAAPQITNNAWARLDLRLDHSNRCWALFANYQLLSTNIAFANTNWNSFSSFNVQGADRELTNYLDVFSVSYATPSNLMAQTNNWVPVLATDVTNINRAIWEGQNAASNVFHVWKDSGYLPLLFTNTITYTNCGVWTNWLSVIPVNSTSYGELKTVWLAFNTTNLPASNQAYQATVRIDGTDGYFGLPASNSPYAISVALLVQGAPRLWVAPLYLTNAVTVSHRPLDQTIAIANTSVPPRPAMAYSVVAQTNWISIAAGSGSVVDETNAVALAYPTENLAPGWHTGLVAVTASGIATQNVQVLMRVNQLPVLAWNAGQRTWTNIITEGENISSFTFDVWNGSAAPTGTLQFTLADDVNWLSLSPVSGTSSGARQTITVAFDVASLPPGGYTGAVTYAGVDQSTATPASNSPLTIVAEVSIRGRATLFTDLASVTNSVLENMGATNAASFKIWNGATPPRGGLNYSITSYADWLSVSPASGIITNQTNTIATIWLSGDRAPGTYSGYVIVDAIDQLTGNPANGAPQTINMQMTVLSRTPVNYEKPTISGVPFIGQTLDANNGLWQNVSRLTFAYQWQHANNTAGGGLANVAGATASNHVVTADEKGKYMRIAVTATDNYPAPRSATAYSDLLSSDKIKAAPGDFNSDGIADLWFFDPLTGMWRAAFAANSFGQGQFGSAGMLDVPGDYNGDGILDLGLYDPAQAMWHILFLPAGPGLSGSLFGGLAEETQATPVPQDYDGDGQTDIALYWRGYWAILYSSLNRIGITPPIADSAATPAPGDYDGDGAVDLGAYHAGLWTIRNGQGQQWSTSFGSAAWLPAVGDYDGDAVADLGIFNQTSNVWALLYSSTGLTNARSFGASSGANRPRQGYYDHDRYCDPATLQYSADGDFVIWNVTRTADTNFSFRGQSYQKSIDAWRVSW